MCVSFETYMVDQTCLSLHLTSEQIGTKHEVAQYLRTGVQHSGGIRVAGISFHLVCNLAHNSGATCAFVGGC